jgi:hypothetical protein
MHLSCVNINIISKQTKMSFNLTHVSLEYHRVYPKWFPRLWYIQRKSVHLCCAKINTISKPIEMSFHSTHVTYVYHWVCAKWFPCPWYIRHKPCPYLASRLTVSPNGPKQTSTWPTSPWSTIGCIKIIFEPMVCSVKPCTHLAPDSDYLQVD